MKIKFNADKIKVNGPKVDGGYSVTFDVGEYEQAKVAELVALPHDSEIKVEVICVN